MTNKKGVLAAWELSEVVDSECNEVPTSDSDHNDPNTADETGNETGKPYPENGHDRPAEQDGFDNGGRQPNQVAVSGATDPDSEVEWITEANKGAGSLYFPGFDPELIGSNASDLWPAIFMDHVDSDEEQDDPFSRIGSKAAEEALNTSYVHTIQ